MSAQVEDLELISQKLLDAIIRDEQLGEAAARKQNNHRQKNRLRCYIHDNRVPDPPSSSLPRRQTVPQAAGLPPSSVLWS